MSLRKSYFLIVILIEEKEPTFSGKRLSDSGKIERRGVWNSSALAATSIFLPKKLRVSKSQIKIFWILEAFNLYWILPSQIWAFEFKEKKVERSSPLHVATFKNFYVLISHPFFEMFRFFFENYPAESDFRSLIGSFSNSNLKSLFNVVIMQWNLAWWQIDNCQ